MHLEKGSSPNIKSFEDLFVALVKLVPEKTHVGARGEHYGSEMFRLKKPTVDAVEDAKHNIVFGLLGNEELTEEQAPVFISSLGAQDRLTLNEAASAIEIGFIITQKLVETHHRLDNLGETADERLALGDAESARTKYENMLTMIGAFLEGLSQNVANSALKSGLAEYADEMKSVPLRIQESSVQEDLDEQ